MGRSAKDDEAAEAARLHRSVDVPQANRLENVRQLAAAVRDGIHDPAALQELLDVDTRHFAYYRQAATILGVVTAITGEMDPDQRVLGMLSARSRVTIAEAERRGTQVASGPKLKRKRWSYVW